MNETGSIGRYASFVCFNPQRLLMCPVSVNNDSLPRASPLGTYLVLYHATTLIHRCDTKKQRIKRQEHFALNAGVSSVPGEGGCHAPHSISCGRRRQPSYCLTNSATDTPRVYWDEKKEFANDRLLFFPNYCLLFFFFFFYDCLASPSGHHRVLAYNWQTGAYPSPCSPHAARLQLFCRTTLIHF